MALEVLVTTPDGTIWRGEAVKVVVPAADGELGILPRHAPLIGALGVGELRIAPTGGPNISILVSGGFVHVLRNKVTVLPSRAEQVATIDLPRAEEELRLLLAEALPAGIGGEARNVRMEKLKLARARVKLGKKKRAG